MKNLKIDLVPNFDILGQLSNALYSTSNIDVAFVPTVNNVFGFSAKIKI